MSVAGVLVVVVGLAYLTLRVSLGVRAARAARAGDHERADELRANGFWLFRAVVGVLGLCTVALVVYLVATR